MYLTHLTIYSLITQSFTYTLTYSHTIAVLYFFSALTITVLISAIISVCVEMPWLNIEKLGMKCIMRSLKPTKKQVEDPKIEE